MTRAHIEQLLERDLGVVVHQEKHHHLVRGDGEAHALALYGGFQVRGAHGRVPLQLPPAVLLPVVCLLYTSPSPRDRTRSRMPSSA